MRHWDDLERLIRGRDCRNPIYNDLPQASGRLPQTLDDLSSPAGESNLTRGSIDREYLSLVGRELVHEDGFARLESSIARLARTSSISPRPLSDL